ncbi:MAG: hypothetical protein ACR2NX_15595 [Chthoniobacterales bacterium]
MPWSGEFRDDSASAIVGTDGNTLPMMTGDGQFGPIEMGGMFTILKIRDGLTSYDDPGWYQNPPGTVAGPINSQAS